MKTKINKAENEYLTIGREPVKKRFPHLIYTLFYFVFIASIPSVGASVKTDLSKCSDIKSATQRLDCYDTVAEYYANDLHADPDKHADSTSSPKALTTPPTVSAAMTPKQMVNASPTGKNLATPKLSEQAVVSEKNSAEAAFGQTDRDESRKSIQSTLIGEFKSWEKGLILKLENGQKWKVTQSNRGYKKMTNPKITISKGLFGSFNAKVEGLNAAAKVKRVK